MPLAKPDTHLPLRAHTWRSATARTAALALGLSVVGSTFPVVAGEVSAQAAPVTSPVRHLDIRKLATRSATASDGKDASASQSRSLAVTAPDVIATVPQGAPLVALTWAAVEAPPSTTAVSVRGKLSSGWTGWTSIDVNTDTDPVAERRGLPQRLGTDPIWLGNVSQVQVRYAAGSKAAVARGRVELIDPNSTPVALGSATPASAVVASASTTSVAASAATITSITTTAASTSGAPKLFTRAQWGANEGLRNCDPDYADTTKAVIVHHTAGTNSYTAAQSASIVRGILAYHTNSLGWCDIGYNVLIDKYGQIFEGRYGGLNRSVIGAHALGFNNGTFGVSMLGNYQTASPSAAALSAVERISAWRLHNYYVDPGQKTPLTSADSGSRYRAGTTTMLPVMTGHRDTYLTACPGTNVWTRLASIRWQTRKLAYYGGSSIYKRWQSLGGARGILGLVSTGEAAVPNGHRTLFAGGRAIYSVPSGNPIVGPGLDGLYWTKGINTWGYPLADERSVPNATRVDFSRGYAALWSSATRGQYTNGAIRVYWDSKGATGSRLKLPQAPMVASPLGGYVQQFQGGWVYWSSASGSHATYDRIATAYRAVAVGGPSSRLGYPTADEVVTTTGTRQAFQHGSIFAPTGGPVVITYA